jgi:ATP-binding cassette subfamily B protein
MSQEASMSPGRRVLRPVITQNWPALAAAGGSTVAVTLADLATPFPLKLVLDQLLANHNGPFALDNGDYRTLAAIGLLVVGIALIDAVASYLADLSLGRAAERITHDLRVRVYSHLQRLSLAYHDRHQKGDLVTRVTGDVNAAGAIFSESIPTIAQASLLLAGMVVVSFILDPILAIVTFAMTPLMGAFAYFYRRRIKKVWARARTQEGEMASLATETLSAMKVVKAFSTERFEQERLEERSAKRQEAGIEGTRLEARFARMTDLLGAVGNSLVIVVGVLRVAAGALSPGDLVVFVSYAKRSYKPMRELARQASRVARSMVRVDRIAELLATDEALEERPGAVRKGRAAGEIELERVSFAYEPDRPALSDVSLHIPSGARIALVGRSGAGKSTLGALIARFYDPGSGSVRIDGRDTRDCALPWLRSQVGILLQDTVLFSGTVAENVAYGTKADTEDVVAACKAAAAHGFISELPGGYGTQLGPQGVGLSAGQRQRIGIARTLLRNPSILVLDEPTTGLDAESEAQVLDGLAILMHGRTTVIVTHSLALAHTADRVMVLDEGRIMEEGSPAQLMSKPGIFHRLASEQGIVEHLSAAPPEPWEPLPPPPWAAEPSGRIELEERPSRPAAPPDPALPQMSWLLDADAMAPVLERSLGRPASVSEVRAVYLRYKPRTNLRVHYEAEIRAVKHDVVVMIAAGADLAGRARKPKNVAMAKSVDGRSPAIAPLLYDPELDALIQWLPLDLSLPALAEPPPRLYRRLRASGLPIASSTSGEPRLLAYRPRRRAVLAIDGHILKAYASDVRYRAAEARLRAASQACPVPTAAFSAALPDLRLIAQARLDGIQPDATDVASEAGATLGTLHAAEIDGLEEMPPARHHAAFQNSAALVEAISPGLRPRVETLASRLEANTPAALEAVLSHGDFHSSQLLQGDAGLAVIDFDEMCAAPAALDLATYAAHEVGGEEDDLARARAILDALVDGYGQRPEGLDWYFSTLILRRASHPFRRIRNDWPERVERMVASAEEALDA